MKVLILDNLIKPTNFTGKFAVNFFKESGVNFYFPNVTAKEAQFHFPAIATKPIELIENIQELKRDAIDPGHHFFSLSFEGNLISAMREAISKNKIDLVFIGTELAEAGADSIAIIYEVIRKIKCNLIIIPAGCRYQKIEKVVLPVSASLLPFKGKLDEIYELEYFKGSRFMLMPIGTGEAKPFPELSPCLTPELFKEIQNEFDLVVILGKNLEVCERLFKKDMGILYKQSLRLPLFIYHESE
ncbi:hypothetical protein [Christiangramia aquimixticola]|uniref:hypothetical protein n=1 Tax=Christiangramia aquimixticola TaxID=1697558 RepID=UPI003AA8C1A9